MIEFSLTRLAHREHGETLIKILSGVSYLNLEVKVCPAGGEFEVWVGSRVAENMDDLKDMVLMILSHEALMAHL